MLPPAPRFQSLFFNGRMSMLLPIPPGRHLPCLLVKIGQYWLQTAMRTPQMMMNPIAASFTFVLVSIAFV
jgi:hypothetical protein